MGDALSQRPHGLASTIAEVSHHLDTQLPGLVHEKTHVFHSVEDLLNSDYAQRRAFSPEARAQLHTAEGFYDSTTGETVIIASNVELRPDESPRDALTRVIVHERVGHDGLKALLGAKDDMARTSSALVSTGSGTWPSGISFPAFFPAGPQRHGMLRPCWNRPPLRRKKLPFSAC